MSEVFWWKTYSPPVWLLGRKGVKTWDLMGVDVDTMTSRVKNSVGPCVNGQSTGVGVVTPSSTTAFDAWMSNSATEFAFESLWMIRTHLNLDDLDFKNDGVWDTLQRVVGKRGLAVWKITRKCT